MPFEVRDIGGQLWGGRGPKFDPLAVLVHECHGGLAELQAVVKLAQAIEDHLATRAYAKNHNLGLEIPYLVEGEPHHYRPDFLVRLDTPEPVTLLIEAKGCRDAKDRLKAEATRHRWIPGVNALGRYGTWVFAELLDPYAYAQDLDRVILQAIGEPA